MKKLRILLILCLTLAVTLPAASANSWNLSGQLLAMVEQTHDYDEYTGFVSDYNRKAATTHTILTSRYHNQLIAAEKGADGWKSVIVSTTAVYQPSEQSTSGKPKLARINNGFELAYPKVKELYRFERISNERGETAYTLTYAKMGGVEVERQESYRYLGDGSHTGKLQHPQYAPPRRGRRAADARCIQQHGAVRELRRCGLDWRAECSGEEKRQAVVPGLCRAEYGGVPRGEGESIRQHGRRL